MIEENINLNDFLLNEIECNKKEIWSKLNNNLKINKIKEFTEESLKKEYELTNDEVNKTNQYLSNLVEKKIITKNNDVVYNKENAKLEKINYLNFNNKTRKFFYKKDKKSSISSTLRKNQKKNNISLKKKNSDIN
ncbi:hypothetical protein CL656_05390 [bacterium]|nr:hypothetical protein [bacterium]